MRALWLLVSLLFAAHASAEDYPARQIRMLEPLAAASAVDVVARLVADHMSHTLGQPVFVDNQPGAGGLLGMRTGAHAAPDGYTILAVNDAVLTVLPNMRLNPGYDPLTDFVPVIELVKLHWVLIANPAFPAKTVQELIAAAKARPGEINYASGGEGSPQHLAMELFMRATGTKFTHVPYRGVTQAFTDVVSGHVPVMFVALPAPLALYASHQLTILATTDLQRSNVLAEVPTISEQGVPGFEFSSAAALVAPKGTPQEIVTKLNKAAQAALDDPAVHKQLTDIGDEVVGGSPEAFGKMISSGHAQMKELLQAADIHAD